MPLPIKKFGGDQTFLFDYVKELRINVKLVMIFSLYELLGLCFFSTLHSLTEDSS